MAKKGKSSKVYFIPLEVKENYMLGCYVESRKSFKKERIDELLFFLTALSYRISMSNVCCQWSLVPLASESSLK